MRDPVGLGEYGPGMTHLAARRRGHPGHVGDHRLGHRGGDEFGRLLLRRAADLADHHDGPGVGVALEGGQAVDEAGARHRVTTDPHAGGLAHPLLGQLVEGLVGEGPRPADDAHRPAGHGDVTGGDPDVALARGDDAGAVRTEQPGGRVLTDQAVVGQGLVPGRDPLGDAHHEGNAGGGGLDDGIGGELGGHRDERGVGPGGLDRLGHRGEYRDALDLLAPPVGVGAGHHPGPVGPVAQPVVEALTGGADALDDHRGALVDEDAHDRPPARATARRAASSMVGSATSRSERWSARISRPATALVPSNRNTMGEPMSTRSSASSTPLATSSTRVIPPKMLTRIERTAGSELITSSAAAITSALAPPPMSRKLAADPPAWVTTSRVLMASPAPLAMMPTEPERSM